MLENIVRPNRVKVRELRRVKKWTQEQLAEKACCSKRTVENIEAGKNVTETILADIAAALDEAMESLCITEAIAQPGRNGHPVAPGSPPACSSHTPEQWDKHSYDWSSEAGAASSDLLRPGMRILYEEHSLDPSYDTQVYRQNHQVRIPKVPFAISPRGFVKLHQADWEWLDPRDRDRRICEGVIREVLPDGRVVLSGRPLVPGDVVDILE